MAVRNLGTVTGISVRPNKPPGFVSIRLDLQQGETVEFALGARAAMTIMRILQKAQKKYGWPIPLTKISL